MVSDFVYSLSLVHREGATMNLAKDRITSTAVIVCRRNVYMQMT